nr:hypothetical protein [Tanacetum cinerariifolium]
QKDEEVCNVNKPNIVDTSDVSKPPGFEHFSVVPPILDQQTKSALWNKLTDFMHNHNGKFILFGDLNVVRNEQERFGSIFSSHEADHFNAFIDSSGLIDLHIGGCYYTLMNKAGTKLSMLDRFLISDDILEKSNFGPSSFNLYNSWLLRDGFDDLIISVWSSMENQPNARSHMSHEKLRSIKGSIKQWHSNIKINDHNKRLEALNDLKVIDKKIDDGSANENDRENHIKLLQDIGNLDNLEAHDLIQKARIKWDIEDEETPNFFMGLLTKRGDPNLLPVLCTMALGLQTREVKITIWDCGSNKAPRPDGFHFTFVKKYWDLLKKDIFEFLDSFLASGTMPEGANSSFFTLIPEKYLDFVLLSLGFGSKWRSWIRAFLYSSRASILINDSPTFEFSIKCGLRHGDALQPNLFILVMEGIHCDMSNAVSSDLIRGIKIASSLKINIHKSNIFGIGVPNGDVVDMARRTDITVVTLVGEQMSPWKDITVVTLVEEQMSPWKGNLLRLPIESNIVLLGNLIDGKSISSESNGLVTQPESILI